MTRKTRTLAKRALDLGLLEGPEAAARTFAECIGAGDLERASECLAQEASLVTPDATVVSGRGAIRGVLFQLIALRSKVKIELSSGLRAGDIAYVRQRWEIASAGLPGAPHVQAVEATLVLRRLGAEWKLVIAAPWGLTGRGR